MADKPAPDEKKAPATADEAAAPSVPEAAAPPPAAKPAQVPVDAARDAAATKSAGAAPAEEAAEAADREALRAEWAEAARRAAAAHDKKVRRFLLRLSVGNWGIAIVTWTISAYLGITSPARIYIYSVLFVIGLVAALIAILTYFLEKFGHEPQPIGAISGDESDDAAAADTTDAATGDTSAPAAT